MDSPSPVPPVAAMPHPDSSTTDIHEGGALSADPLPGGAKLRLMCSYGGHITPRPHDNSLCYVGGDTRIVVVDRNSTLSELLHRLSRILLAGRSFTLKYQLPTEDLDSLITVSSEEDLENMIEEYDRLNSTSNAAKPSRIRLFLFPAKLEVAASMGPILDGSNKSDEWFLNALNGASILQRGFSDPASAYSLLDLNNSGNNLEPNPKESTEAEGERGLGLGGGKGKIGNLSNQDVHSIPDSPVVETSSSFGSTSSSPSMTNLPPVRVQVEGARVFDQRIGIDEQLAQMGIGAQKQEDSFAPPMSSIMPPNLPNSGVVTGGEYTDRIISDDERSDHSVPVGYRKPPQPQTTMLPVYHAQPKQMSGDLLSPDSIASDNSLSNASSRQNPTAIYQDTFGSNLMPPPPNLIDPNSGGAHIQMQQVSNSSYMMPQYELHQQQIQPQQYVQVQANNQYVHHQLPGGVPVYYVPAGQQPQNHHAVYYVPSGQAYNLQPNCTEVPQNAKPPNPTLNSAYNVATNLPPQKADITQAGVYSTTTNISPQLLQVPSHLHHHQQQQQQFVGYSQVQHQSISPPPSSVSTAPGYAYELADPAQSQLYFTQPLAPQMAAQYQTMTSSSTMVLSDVSSADRVNQQ